MKRYSFLHQRGAVSIEFAIIIPVMLMILVASNELLRIVRVELRVTNLTQNIVEMVGKRRILTRDNNIDQLPFFVDYADQSLSKIVDGKASMVVSLHDAESQQTIELLRHGNCPGTFRWPQLGIASLVGVRLCFQPSSEIRSNAIWSLWPSERFTMQIIRETNG